MLGGYGGSPFSLTDVSLFFPATNNTCRGPDLPECDTFTPQVRVLLCITTACQAITSPKDVLADGVILICGGVYTPTSCDRLEPGSSSWVHHAEISSRNSHVSWTAPSGDIILMGAQYNEYGPLATTEIVGRGSSFTLARPTE